jgi:hypothetical protein
MMSPTFSAAHPTPFATWVEKNLRAMALTDAAATQLPGIQHSYGGVDGFLAPQAEIVPATFTDHDFLLIETRLVPPARP